MRSLALIAFALVRVPVSLPSSTSPLDARRTAGRNDAEANRATMQRHMIMIFFVSAVWSPRGNAKD
ncbi:hypothetical protein Pcac1_g12464 [Phytophthora cactorum]|nr:hypothetical protein Pcac1_g12464 [Phytophthora cactorum]